MDKVCVNGITREMTVEELKEQETEIIQEEKPSVSFEERLEKLENILEKFTGLIK